MAEMEIHRDERVLSMDGNEIGRVKHVIVDGPTHQVTDLVVARDGQEYLIPLNNVERGADGAIMLRGTGAQVSNMMAFTRDGYHDVDEEMLNDTPARAVPGAATLEHADNDSVVIEDTRTATPMRERVTETPAMDTRRETTRERVTETPAVDTTRRTTERVAETGDNITVPVVEERLTAGVREREAGRFRLVKSVREEERSIDVPVRQEEVYITETHNRRPATEADLSAMDRDIEIPLTEQEAFAQKTARVTGEVNIHKDVTTENQRVTDTVRREEVHVEGGNTEHVHVEGMNDTQRGWFSNLSREEQMRYRDMSPADRTTYEREYNARSGRGEGVVDKAKDAVRNVENKGRDR